MLDVTLVCGERLGNMHGRDMRSTEWGEIGWSYLLMKWMPAFGHSKARAYLYFGGFGCCRSSLWWWAWELMLLWIAPPYVCALPTNACFCWFILFSPDSWWFLLVSFFSLFAWFLSGLHPQCWCIMGKGKEPFCDVGSNLCIFLFRSCWVWDFFFVLFCFVSFCFAVFGLGYNIIKVLSTCRHGPYSLCRTVPKRYQHDTHPVPMIRLKIFLFFKLVSNIFNKV